MPIQLRRVTVRFSPLGHALVERKAQESGTTFAQYVREAALMRAAWENGLAMGEDPDSWEAFLRELGAVRAEMVAFFRGENGEAEEEGLTASPPPA